jgi:hypothetical protein
MNVTGPSNSPSLSFSSALSEEQNKLLEAMRKEKPGLADLTEQQFRLQNLQEAVTLATNIMKQLHDMRMSITNNMR